MSLLKPQSSRHPKFTKFIDATGLVGWYKGLVVATGLHHCLSSSGWRKQFAYIFMLVFKKLMLFDRLYYFFQNKGEDWEISLYVN